MKENDTKQQAPDGYISLDDAIRIILREEAAKTTPPSEEKERTLAVLHEMIAEKNAK
jgi:hypothetical protein